MSFDGRYTVVVIALLGSPFSNAYASDRASPPLDFCAMNVALYGPDGLSMFSLNERAITARDRSPNALALGRSTLFWEGSDALVLDLDERTSPAPLRRGGAPIRGRIRLLPEGAPTRGPRLLADGHSWWPIAPISAIEVELDEPRLRFRGHGYHDANYGVEPLEAAFRTWRWSRARLSGDRALVHYDTVDRHGVDSPLSLEIDRDGHVQELDDALESRRLPRSRWGLQRGMRTAPSAPLHIVRDLEDGPFYTRSLVRGAYAGEPLLFMHEEMSCDRLASAWVRFLMQFRMGNDELLTPWELVRT